jgi:hypothetical protein
MFLNLNIAPWGRHNIEKGKALLKKIIFYPKKRV